MLTAREESVDRESKDGLDIRPSAIRLPTILAAVALPQTVNPGRSVDSDSMRRVPISMANHIRPAILLVALDSPSTIVYLPPSAALYLHAHHLFGPEY